MWLNNCEIALPDQTLKRGAIQLDGETIRTIIEGDAPSSAADVFDTDGLTILPGIIDLHGDMLERDIEPRPNARFPTDLALFELDKRLAASGITTAYTAVSFAWQQNDLRTQEKATEIIETIGRYKDRLLVDMKIHGRFEITNTDTAALLRPMLESKQIELVSLNDHTPGQGQYKNIAKYVDFMTRWLGFDPDKIGTDLIERVGQSIETKTAETRTDWTQAREIAALALQFGINVASHDDDTVDKVAAMDEMGVTISEFPVTPEAGEEARRRGMYIVMGAPNAYRGKSTSDGNLSARDAIQQGIVDILASDYFPAAMLQSALLLADQGIMSLHESMKLVSTNPADALHLPDRGRIAVGQRADLLLVAREAGHTPRLHGTLRAGHPIYWDGRMAALSRDQGFRFPLPANVS